MVQKERRPEPFCHPRQPYVLNKKTCHENLYMLDRLWYFITYYICEILWVLISLIPYTLITYLFVLPMFFSILLRFFFSFIIVTVFYIFFLYNLIFWICGSVVADFVSTPLCNCILFPLFVPYLSVTVFYFHRVFRTVIWNSTTENFIFLLPPNYGMLVAWLTSVRTVCCVIAYCILFLWLVKYWKISFLSPQIWNVARVVRGGLTYVRILCNTLV